MALPINFNNVTYPAGFIGTDDGAPASTFQIDDASTGAVRVNGQVTGVGSSVTLTGILQDGDTASTVRTVYATQYDNAGMILFTDFAGGTTGTTRYVLSNTQVFGTGNPNRTRFTADNNNAPGDYNVAAAPCFASGTRIRVLREGVERDVAVGNLVVGDLAVTASGEHRPIRWIGSRTVHPRRERMPEQAQPVRIAAHAFGDNRPARDLVVSPGHSIAVDVLGEVLIMAVSLVNGSTVVQEDVASVTYWHVELDSHDLLIAENQPAESYLDMENRAFFGEGAVVALGARPDADPAARTHADFCRPFHDGGPVVAFVRERMQARAKAHGWSLSTAEPWGGVHLIADGVRVEPEVQGLAARFRAPAGARNIWLVSPTAAPSEVGVNADTRQLGLQVVEMRVGDGWTARAVALNDPLLCAGLHGVEGEAGALRRWTAGRTLLPAALWTGEDRTLVLHIAGDMPALPRWVGPSAAADEAPHTLSVAA